MQRTLFAIIATLERGLRLFGLDVYTVPDDSGLGFLSFERKDHGTAGREYWGAGLHCTVARLTPSQRA